MDTDELGLSELGWLCGGDWAATQTALAALQRRGALRVGRAGMVERLTSAHPGDDPLERALYGAMYGAVGPRELMNKPRPRSALRQLRRKLSAAGLVRPAWRRVAVPAALVALPAAVLARFVAAGTIPAWLGGLVVLAAGCAVTPLVFRRTIAGDRTLRRLRGRYSHLTRAIEDASAVTPADVGLAVALFGNAALLAVWADVARDGGLLDGGRWWTNGRQPSETPAGAPPDTSA